jgi:MFS family permease
MSPLFRASAAGAVGTLFFGVGAMNSRLYTPSFFLIAAANLFTVSSFGAFYLFPLFISSHGGSKMDIGVAMGSFALSSVVFRPWISEMIDRLGRKRSYTLGCMLMTAMPLAYLFLQGQVSVFYVPLVLFRVLHGAGLAICFTAVFTYVADIIPTSRLNEGLGMFGVTGLSGLAIGPILGELAIRQMGFRGFFWAAAVMAALGLLSHLGISESVRSRSSEPVPSFFSVLRRRKILAVAILSAVFGIGLSASGGFVAPLASERHLGPVSVYYLCYSLSAVLTRFSGGRLADRIGEKRLLTPGMILAALGLMALMIPGGVWILVVAGCLSGGGHGFLFPCLNAIAVRDEPYHLRGKITGAFTGGMDAGAFVGSIALGYIGDWLGFEALFLVAGVVLFAGLAIQKAIKI